jgi:hypothetical protein
VIGRDRAEHGTVTGNASITLASVAAKVSHRSYFQLASA